MILNIQNPFSFLNGRNKIYYCDGKNIELGFGLQCCIYEGEVLDRDVSHVHSLYAESIRIFL